MVEIDRMAVVIRPTQSFADWINASLEGEEKIPLEDLLEDCTIVLIQPFEDILEAEAYIESVYPTLFENELAAWDMGGAYWPDESLRTYSLFLEWFDIDYHSYVIDTVNTEASPHLHEALDTIQ